MSLFTRRLIVAAAALTLTMMSAPAYAAESKKAPDATQSAEKKVVARVNGVAITQMELDNTINSLMPLVTYHSSVDAERYSKIRKKALDQLVNNELFYEKAMEDKSLTVSPKDIDAEIEALKKRLGKTDTIEKVLKRSDMTMPELREYFKRQALVRHMGEKKTNELRKKAEAAVTDDYMKDYYQKNRGKFKEPEKVHLSSILIKADPSGGQRARDEARKKADEVARKAKAGEDFKELAKKYSEDPNAANGGDMGWSHKGSLYQEMDSAAEKMKVGEISDPVLTIYGYHVLRLEGRQPSVQKKFEEINRQTLKKELQAKEFNALSQKWLDELRGRAKIEIMKEQD